MSNGSFPKLLFPKWGQFEYRAPYYNRNLNIGPRINSNLGQSPNVGFIAFMNISALDFSFFYLAYGALLMGNPLNPEP